MGIGAPFQDRRTTTTYCRRSTKLRKGLPVTRRITQFNASDSHSFSAVVNIIILVVSSVLVLEYPIAQPERELLSIVK